MVETEYDILDAVRDLHSAQYAINCGAAPLDFTKKAYAALMKACDEHCNENDGHFPLEGDYVL